MSTNTSTRPLYTDPSVLLETKRRFAAVLALRAAAERALDKALSLPRSAIHWAISMFQRWADAAASMGVFSWLREQAGNTATMIRAAGVVPVAVAVLSTPPIAAAATRLARFVGNGLRRVASSTWAGLKGLLARCGATGARITQGLAQTGAKVVEAARAMAAHPVMVPVAQALRATLALVRPISQGLVAHRLLGALVPLVWLRTLIGLLVMPLLVDTALAHGVRDYFDTPPAEPASDGDGVDDAQATGNSNNNTGSGADDARADGNHTGLLIDAFGPAVPTEVPIPTNGSLPTDGAPTDEDPPLNRATRRAQQREDARARRPRR